MNVRILGLCCLLGVGGSVFSQPGDGNDPRPGKMPIMGMGPAGHGMNGPSDILPPMMLNLVELQKLMSEINIKNEVSTKIMAITRAFQSTLDDRIIKIQREELNIKEELLKEKPDLQKIQGTISKKTQLFGEIEFAQVKRDLDIKSLLTQDEYDRWKDAMIRKMREMMPNFMEKRMPNQPGAESPRK